MTKRSLAGVFDYRNYLNTAGIPKGAVLDVASDLFSVGLFCMEHDLLFDPRDLLDALKTAVGEEGTLLIRAFSWDFCKGETFDIRKTKSQVGSLGNIAMRSDSFRRTKHPIYSWMVWGRYQRELCELNNIESFGADSPFDFLYKHDAMQLFIGKQEDGPSTTIAHYAEKVVGVPFRCEKEFKAGYIDEEGNRTNRVYSMFVRPLNIAVRFAYADIVSMGIEKDYLYRDELPISTIDLHAYVNFIKNDIQNNDGKFTVTANGTAGIESSGVDWNSARFF